MHGAMIVFDMDGVLVDVSESYRETIRRTVEHFSGAPLSREEIQDWKNRGGWNDDWALSTAMIRARGVDVERDTVVEYFQSIFHGDGTDGLIMRERWIATPGMLERLHEQFRFAVFTGRMKWEAEFTLRRFAGDLRFEPIVGAGEVAQHKPAPEGLLHLGQLLPGTKLWYVGDTVDDARSAAAAGVDFIGIAAPSSPRHPQLVTLLAREGARAVLEDINLLHTVIL